MLTFVLVFTFGSIAISFFMIWFVDKVLKREKAEPEFAEKMDRFRASVARFIPSEGMKQFIAVAFFVGLVVYWLFH